MKGVGVGAHWPVDCRTVLVDGAGPEAEGEGTGAGPVPRAAGALVTAGRSQTVAPVAVFMK